MGSEQRSAFSSDGYLVDQARVTDIRYGAFQSSVNGCGWIAAYNFLKRQGVVATERDVADELIRRAPLRGLTGTDLFRLKRMLRRRGYDTALKIVGRRGADLPEGTTTGVILYFHKDGPHYVAFYERGDGAHKTAQEKPRFRFLNAIAGKEDHFDTLAGFLTKHSVLPLAAVLTWPRAKAR
jgi:hypothetical protein